MIPSFVLGFLKEILKDKETMKKLAEYSSREFWYIVAIFVLIFSSVNLASQLVIAENKSHPSEVVCDNKIKPVIERLSIITNEYNHCLKSLDDILNIPVPVIPDPPLAPVDDNSSNDTPDIPKIPRRKEYDINDLIDELG